MLELLMKARVDVSLAGVGRVEVAFQQAGHALQRLQYEILPISALAALQQAYH